MEEEEEEFQEADIVFPDPDTDRVAAKNIVTNVPSGERRASKRRRRPKASSQQQQQQHRKKSAPIDVPLMMGFAYGEYPAAEDDGGESSLESTPPHILIGRRAGERMVCSVCTGHGRTLKGRDLLRVRNSVLRMTGFYEK